MASGFLKSDLGKMLNYFFCKEGELPKYWNTKTIQNYMYFHHDKRIRENASKIDKYLFSLYKKPEVIKSLIDVSIPKHSRLPFIRYIKPLKEKAETYEFLIEEISKFCDWSDKEIEFYTPVLISELEKMDIKQLLIRFGADDKVWRKMKIKKDTFKAVKIEKKVKSLTDFC